MTVPAVTGSGDRESRIAKITGIAADIFRKRIETLGEVESGAYAFYVNKLKRGDHLTRREHALIEELIRSHRPETTYFEIGAGVAFFSIALAAAGIPVVAVESDPRRVTSIKCIRDELVVLYPDLASLFDVEKVRFGVESVTSSGDPSRKRVAICLNLANGWIRDNQSLVVQELMKFDEFVVDMMRFGDLRDRSRAQEVISMFPKTRSALFVDHGNGMYYRFTTMRP